MVAARADARATSRAACCRPSRRSRGSASRGRPSSIRAGVGTAGGWASGEPLRRRRSRGPDATGRRTAAPASVSATETPEAIAPMTDQAARTPGAARMPRHRRRSAVRPRERARASPSVAIAPLAPEALREPLLEPEARDGVAAGSRPARAPFPRGSRSSETRCVRATGEQLVDRGYPAAGPRRARPRSRDRSGRSPAHPRPDGGQPTMDEHADGALGAAHDVADLPRRQLVHEPQDDGLAPVVRQARRSRAQARSSSARSAATSRGVATCGHERRGLERHDRMAATACAARSRACAARS